MTPDQILFEDNHLLVVNKPAQLATMGAESGPTLHSMACEYLKKKYQKPGNVYLGVVSRLDAMTTGVIVLARTSKAAARLNQQFAKKDQQSADKIYLALVAGALSEGSTGQWKDQVYKDDIAHRMRTTDTPNSSSKEADLSWICLHSQSEWSLVAIKLNTGRKHQIRLQFSARDCPVLGDRKYDSTVSFKKGIALHSWRLSITHPVRKESMWFDAPLPKTWSPYLQQVPVDRRPGREKALLAWISRGLQSSVSSGDSF